MQGKRQSTFLRFQRYIREHLSVILVCDRMSINRRNLEWGLNFSYRGCPKIRQLPPSRCK
jgi:hypothetical protein